MAKYSDELALEMAKKYATGEHTIKEICEKADIDKSTWYDWKENKSYFSNLLKEAEEQRVESVRQMSFGGMVKKLLGYTYETEEKKYERVIKTNDDGDVVYNEEHLVERKVKEHHVEPSDTMIIFALTNTDPRFKRRQYHNLEGSEPGSPVGFAPAPYNLDGLNEKELRALKAINKKAVGDGDDLSEEEQKLLEEITQSNKNEE